MKGPQPLTFPRSLPLAAAVLVCLAAVGPARAQGFDLFHRQSAQTAPPADIPGAAGGADEAAGLLLRVNRHEEALRQANGRIEELENAERRLESELQKFRQDVEFRFCERSGGAPPAAGPVAAAERSPP